MSLHAFRIIATTNTGVNRNTIDTAIGVNLVPSVNKFIDMYGGEMLPMESRFGDVVENEDTSFSIIVSFRLNQRVELLNPI